MNLQITVSIRYLEFFKANELVMCWAYIIIAVGSDPLELDCIYQNPGRGAAFPLDPQYSEFYVEEGKKVFFG